MSRTCVALVVLVFGLCQFALAIDELAVIYNGESQLPASVVLGDWGYLPRDAKETMPFQPQRLSPGRKVYALMLSTLGRYQGARFDFRQPLNAAALFEQTNVYLEMYLRAMPNDKDVDAKVLKSGEPTEPVAPTDPESPATGEIFPAALDSELAQAPVSVPLPALKNLRFTFFTEKGQGLLEITPDQFYPKDEVARYWVRVAIPLSLLNKSLPIGGKITRMLITSDTPVRFQVGRLAFVRDTDPFEVRMFIHPPFLEAKQRIFFAARVEPGLTPYEVSWHFDAVNRDKVDAVGERITYTYDTEGLYTITCTVRDKTGGKPPATDTIEVKISRPAE